MKLLAAFFSILVFAHSAFSLEADPSDFVVKITSIKSHESVVFGGSGVLVNYRGQTYAITSEHVLLHDNDQTTHKVQLDGQAAVSATYLMADWGVGLALLKVDKIPASEKLPDLEKLVIAKSATEGSAAMLAGFPYHANSIVADATGIIDSTTTSSEILVDVEKMVQISGANAEFGMSGGAVLGDDASLIGILSHENPDPVKKVIFAIPIDEAARWALKAVTDATFKPTLFRTSEDLLTETRYGLHIRSGLLAFKWSSMPYDNRPPCVEISPDRSWIDAPTKTPEGPFYSALLKRFEKFRISPRSYPTAYVTSFRSPDLLQAKASWSNVGTLISFFRRVKDSANRPVAMFDYQGQQIDQLNWDYNRNATTLHTAMVSGSQNLNAALQVIEDATEFTEDQEQLNSYRPYPMDFLNAADFDGVFTNFKSELQKIRAAHPEEYEPFVNAMKAMREIVDQLSI